MEKIGIICEYNPFHNGHLYHLRKIKEKYPDSLIVLVMSSCFTQRGNISILTKEEKAMIALNYGIDLIVELPFVFASQSADVFAKGAISILKELDVDYLVFGSETNDVTKLEEMANIQLNNSQYEELVKEYIKEGISYPTAMSKAIKKITNLDITTPNDLLGLSYIKEIIRQKTKIIPITIKRTNDFHSTDLKGQIVSATAIRKALKEDKDIKDFVPEITYNFLKNKKENNYYPLLKYKVIIEKEEIKRYQTVDEGIENRIINNINKCQTTNELIEKIKTKRYTYNKLSRMLIHILTSLTKEEGQEQELKYIRVLGFNNFGKDYLNNIKKDLSLPLITNIKKKDEDLLKIDIRVEKIYALINHTDPNSYKNPPIQRKETI